MKLRVRFAFWRHDHACPRGLHWPIQWSEYAYPGSDYEPPEPWWACDTCGWVSVYGNYRMRFRAWITPSWWVEWRFARMLRKDAER